MESLFIDQEPGHLVFPLGLIFTIVFFPSGVDHKLSHPLFSRIQHRQMIFYVAIIHSHLMKTHPHY